MPSRIGTLNEGPLHAAIKALLAPATGAMEAPVPPYTVDIVDGDQIVEIQTTGFSAIRRKMWDLVETRRVRLVHPIPAEKWILVEAADGTVRRRKSPRRGGFADVFTELVSFPTILAHPRFELEVILTREEEVRRLDPRRAWRRRGWVVVERRLCGVADRRLFRSPRDLWGLLVPEPRETFGSADLARALARPRWLGQKAAYCLKACGLIRPVGRDRRGVRYVTDRPADAGAARRRAPRGDLDLRPFAPVR